MAPRIIKLLKGNKRKHNQGPDRPITRKEVEGAGGSLERVYRKRAARGGGFEQDVVAGIEEVGPSFISPEEARRIKRTGG